MFEKYTNYIKDNPERYWFKRKLYGWGWTPATWQGWATMAIILGLIIWDTYHIDARSHSASDTLMGVSPHIAVLILILLAICWKKGESPRWQWGIPKK